MACPGCAQSLEDWAACAHCGANFPAIDGIPLLVTHPREMISDWRRRLHGFMRDNQRTRLRITSQLGLPGLVDVTHARLERLLAGLDAHRERIVTLLESAGITQLDDGDPTQPAVPGEASITAYYHQIHRDWAWPALGNNESADQWKALDEVLGSEPLGRVLVLGAGACRLAYDLHVHRHPPSTIAIDLNPLPFIVANRLLRGESLPLFEFAVRPARVDDVCVDHELGPVAPAPGLQLLFADGLAPPVVARSFDTVVTPWFIDQVPPDIATFADTVVRTLRPGGRWVNSGPLIYHPAHTAIAHRYGPDELFALLAQRGFDVSDKRMSRVSYMRSPHGTQGRTETLVSFCAVAPSTPTAITTPEWLQDADLRIPAFPALADYRAPHPMFARVASLIDGTRSTRDIADLLVAGDGLPRESALDATTACVRAISMACTDVDPPTP